MDKKDSVFKLVQKFLRTPPLIVWGSGATIPFGLPSMEDLNQVLQSKVDNFNCKNDNLEIELGKDIYKEQLPQIKQIIWDEVNNKDIAILKRIANNNVDEFNGIRLLIEKFIDAHPKVVNIVTTNYDRTLEYVMAYSGISYTDGFNGKTFSKFDDSLFKGREIVNLIKVHGSLNWFDVDGEIRFLPSFLKQENPKIIIPSNKKYQEAHDIPYRELIQKSDNEINEASSFLVIGFGFNDEHLTPKIKDKVREEVPIVLITKAVSESSLSELTKAKKYILFEESKSGKTKITYKESNLTKKKEVELAGDLWQLEKFMEIL